MSINRLLVAQLLGITLTQADRVIALVAEFIMANGGPDWSQLTPQLQQDGLALALFIGAHKAQIVAAFAAE